MQNKPSMAKFGYILVYTLIENKCISVAISETNILLQA